MAQRVRAIQRNNDGVAKRYCGWSEEHLRQSCAPQQLETDAAAIAVPYPANLEVEPGLITAQWRQAAMSNCVRHCAMCRCGFRRLARHDHLDGDAQPLATFSPRIQQALHGGIDDQPAAGAEAELMIGAGPSPSNPHRPPVRCWRGPVKAPWKRAVVLLQGSRSELENRAAGGEGLSACADLRLSDLLLPVGKWQVGGRPGNHFSSSIGAGACGGCLFRETGHVLLFYPYGACAVDLLPISTTTSTCDAAAHSTGVRRTLSRVSSGHMGTIMYCWCVPVNVVLKHQLTV
jgi:hypothetical protein